MKTDNTERPRDWTSTRTHGNKRALSSYEKSSLRPVHTVGQALIMPSVPGTEIEELIAIGFSPRNLHCVEETEELADTLYTHYWEQVSVHLIEFSDFLVRATTPFTYIHADYCGHLRREQIAGIEEAVTHLDHYARLRISIMSSRRGEDQLNDERIIAERILVNLARACAERDDAGAQRWHSLIAEFDFTDPTIVVAAIMIINVLFDMRTHTYCDLCVLNGPSLPNPTEKFRIIGLHRYHYNEPPNGNVMGSVWVDVAPSISGGMKLVIEECYTLLRSLTRPSIPFTNPDMFT